MFYYEKSGVILLCDLMVPHIFCAILGNMLWPGLLSLENIVNDPITNGEGNILSLAATIYVMDYLNAVGKVSYEIEMKAMEIMEKCMTRI